MYTDHKPLTHAVARVSDPWTARQCWHLAYIAEYTSDIQHVAGTANVVADTLSRPPGHVQFLHLHSPLAAIVLETASRLLLHPADQDRSHRPFCVYRRRLTST
jgi:hypothetical protein